MYQEMNTTRSLNANLMNTEVTCQSETASNLTSTVLLGHWHHGMLYYCTIQLNEVPMKGVFINRLSSTSGFFPILTGLFFINWP